MDLRNSLNIKALMERQRVHLNIKTPTGDGEMDLTGMLKDASLSNLEWLADPETYMPEDNNGSVNIKDELENYWQNGSESANIGKDKLEDLYRSQQRERRERFQEADKNKDSDEAAIIKYANDVFMSGVQGVDAITALREKFGMETLEKNKDALSKIFKYDGIVGCIAVDVSCYSTVHEAMKAASLSPNKRFIKFIIGYGSRDTIQTTTDIISNDETGNPLDDFFTQEETKVASKIICPITSMPIISGQQDLDDEDMDETMLDLVTLGRITKEDAAEIKAQDASNFLKIKTAFGLMNIKHKISEREKYSQPVDTSMHVVNSDFGVPVDEKYDNPELQIAHVGYKLDAEVEAATYKGDVDIDNKVGLSVIELAEKKAKEVEMKIDLSHIDKIEIEKKADNSLLDVDRRSKTINVELDEKFASLDIEPDAYVAEEYEGGGDIDIDEAKKAKDEIDIGFDDVGFTF